MDESEFRIIKSHDGYVIKRIDGEYGHHSHFHSRQGAQKLLRLIVKGVKPKEDYFITAAKRILTEDEFNSLTIKQKPSYYNHNKMMYTGGKRCAK
jgi:hypothetical protein